jgi:beta-lactamase class D
LHAAQSGHTICHDVQRVGTRYLHASTFKLPNTLIALETGVASGPDFFVRRDRAAVPPQPWRPLASLQDHTLVRH